MNATLLLRSAIKHTPPFRRTTGFHVENGLDSGDAH
jgi:hypothetical protein